MASLRPITYVNGLATLPKSEPLDDQTHFTLLRKLGRGSWEPKLPRPNYYNLDRGVTLNASVPARPCSAIFIMAVSKHLWLYTTLLVLKFPMHVKGNLSNVLLPDDVRTLMKYLGLVMKECRRLKDAPELFSSPHLRQDFLARLAILTKELQGLQEIITANAAIDIKARKALPHVTPLEDDPSAGPLENAQEISTSLPLFYPDKINGKHPWNNWLDNSGMATTGWVAIQQKIPQIGDKMNRMKTLHLQALEDHFTDHELVVGTDEDAPGKIGKPGGAYEHMTWSAFATVANYNLGFNRGNKRPCDDMGIITLEELGNSVQLLYEDQNEGLSQSFPNNVPYFKFAVAYQP
ncbi:hypothetical protein PVAG01_08673 [Phlyctema vagabunda]|uniref:Uncharacterized protein n=1 Tax=Phlyctema vagabunda TaxID=108571 RepID=A0ABR4PA30_9HELO